MWGHSTWGLLCYNICMIMSDRKVHTLSHIVPQSLLIVRNTSRINQHVCVCEYSAGSSKNT